MVYKHRIASKIGEIEMELSELKFVVDTSSLEDAAKKIAELGTAVNKLNKPMQDLTKESAKSNKELSKAEEVAAKAASAQVKLQQAQEKSTEATGKSTSTLERQNLILEYMAQGNSKGQASILATAKAAGALDDDMLQLNNTLKTQRALIGGDPFDKSIGLMQKLKNEYKTSTEVTSLFNKNLGLTEKQMVDLSREKERLITLYGIEGRDIKGLASEYDSLIQKSVGINQANAARTNSMHQQVKVQNDTAKANAYMAEELERVNRLTASGGGITTATNNKLIKFEKALKLSGQTASEQVTALEQYKKSLQSIQKAGGDRQVDYLSRALGPQITDIAVGLATGQAPLTILLQQGGQLRDQFALAGVASKDMGAMLTKATLGMVSSVKDVALAIGGALGSAILATGNSFVNFAGKITGVNAGIDLLKRKIASLGEESFGFIGTLNKIGSALSLVAGIGVATAVAAFIAFGVAIKQVISEESALSKSIALTGASLGLTQDSALALSKELAGSKSNVGSYVTTLTDIAKAGGITSNNLKTVASTIVNVSKILGISSEDLAKNFSKISEKPLEGLIPFAKELGTIDVAILKQIQSLERANKHTEAAKVATEAYAKALRDAANIVKNDAGYIETFFKGIAEAATNVWHSIMNWGSAIPLVLKLAEAQKELLDLQSGKGFMTDQYRKNSIQVAEATVEGIKKQITAEKKLGDTKAKNAKEVAAFEKTLKEQGGAQFKVPEDLFLKALKEDYRDTTKEIDSESKKLLAQNKSSYDLGLIETGTYLSEEIRLIQDQNNQKIKTNSDFTNSFKAAKDIQIAAINAMVNKEMSKTKTSEDAKKLEEQRVESIKSVTEAYKLLTEGLVSNTEVLKDNSAEQQAKSIAILGQETKKLMESSKDFIRTQDDIIAKRVLATELEQKTAGLFGAEAARVKAQIEMQQSHIDKLSELEKMATKAKEALKALSESSMPQTSPEFVQAKSAVDLAQEDLDKAKVKSKEAIEKAGFDAATKYQDLATQRLNSYGASFEKMFSGMADAIVDFAKTGKLNFGGLVDSMIADLIRFEVKAQMMKMYESTGGAKGIMGAITGAFTGSPSPTTFMNDAGTVDMSMFAANGAAFDSSGIQAFAKGGSFSNSVVDSPTLFKFAKGTGMMGEAGPEAIMPLRRGSDGSLGVVASGGSSGNVSVNVINNSSSQATTSETTDSKGNRKIEVVIGDMTAGEISRSGSASQKSIKSTFGLQPQLIRR